MTSKVKGTEGIEFPDATQQASAAIVNGPAFLARKTSTSTITSAANVVVICDEEIFDTGGAYDTSTGKFQPTVAGYYQVNGAISTNTTGTTTGWTGAYIRKNGLSGVYYAGYVLGVAGAVTGLPVSTLVYLNGTTDYLELVAFITAGAPKVYGDSTSSYVTYWSASLVRKA